MVYPAPPFAVLWQFWFLPFPLSQIGQSDLLHVATSANITYRLKDQPITEEGSHQEKVYPISKYDYHKLKCDLCNVDYIGYTTRHLHQRVEEHKSQVSATECHMKTEHNLTKPDNKHYFKILKRCKSYSIVLYMRCYSPVTVILH